MAEEQKQSLFDAVGGLPVLDHVHKVFYDKIYVHPWLGQYFAEHDQVAIERRQTQFMAEKMGSNVDYFGKGMKMAHRAMYITQEMFDIRKVLLTESLAEVGVADDLAQRWLKIDSAFQRQIIKDSIESFYSETWQFEKRIIHPKPQKG